MSKFRQALLPVLMLLSGFCGISYEILYAKLLGNLLGDRFTIAASVLLTFLLGIGLGTLYAHRLVRWLWAIELGIGVYAAALVLAYPAIDHLLYAWIPALGVNIYACAAVSVTLLVGPAFLVGCSVPLFAAYLGEVRTSHVFSLTYGMYNIGAALTALALEFVLLRVAGLRAATLILASMNVGVGLVLLALFRTAAPLPVPGRVGRVFGRRVLGALALGSVGSAVFQLLMIKVGECILGPFNETFALVLAITLVGLSVGAWAVMRLGLTFRAALLLATIGCVSVLVLLPHWVTLYAATYQLAMNHHVTLVMLKFGLLAALMGLPAIGFGATVPALLTEHSDVARESGRVLFVSSMANVCGFILLAFVLHQRFEYGQLIIIVAAMATGGVLLHAGRRPRAALGAIVVLVLGVVSLRATWDESLLYYGHEKFHSSVMLERARSGTFSAERFKGHQDLFAIIELNGRPYFFINGYISISLRAASEKIVGALSASFAPRLDEALVLGVGSGATAGTVGLLFDHTEAVEINDTILANLDLMSEHNFRIKHQPTLQLIHDDAIRYIKTTPKHYSLILNTVTSPLYFSSSKLYTEDFYKMVVDRLTPDGVYTTWIDRDIGDYGVDIILNTLKSTFDNCWMTYIKSSYYLMVCSNDEIGLHQLANVSKNKTLHDYLATRHRLFYELFPYSVLATDAFKFIGQNTPTNRLDRPVLEQEMAQLHGGNRLFVFTDHLIDRSNLHEVSRAMAPWFAWDPGGFLYWSDTRLSNDSLLREALDEIVDKQFGDVSEDYARVALRLAQASGEAGAYEEVGDRLYHRDLIEPAMEAYTASLERDPEDKDVLYRLGRCHEQLGHPEQAAEYFQRLLGLEPENKDALEGLARLHHRDGPTG